MTLLTNDARRAIAAALQAASTNSPLPAFNHLRIENGADVFSAVGANGDMQVTATAPRLDGAPFAVCVPADRLGKVMAAAKETVDISMTEKGVAIRTGASRFMLPPLPAEDFPMQPAMEAKGSFSVPAAALKEALVRVLPFAAEHDVRYYLNGLFLQLIDGTLYFMATDGAGMAYYSTRIHADEFVIIMPMASCRKIKGMLGDGEVCISIDGRRAKIVQDGMEISTQLIDPHNLDWRRVIPVMQKGVAVVKAAEAEAVMAEAAIVAASDKAGHWVELDISPRGIRAVSGTPDRGGYERVIECSPSLPMKAAYNVAALREIFSLFPKDADVRVGFTPTEEKTAPTPMTFTSEALPGYMALYQQRRI